METKQKVGKNMAVIAENHELDDELMKPGIRLQLLTMEAQ